MNPFRMITRSIRDAIKSVFRNFSLSLASIACITITLIIVSIAIIASFNLDHMTNEIEDDLTVVVFLERDVTDLDIEYVEDSLRSISNIEHIEFKCRMAVTEEMIQSSDEFRIVLEGLDRYSTPLADTFLLQVYNLSDIRDTVKLIEQIENVAAVQFGEEMVDTLITTFSTVTVVAFTTVAALIIVTIFLIINTIKLTIFSRQREIGIMRLVGASNFTIKTPFLIEGMILGLIGSIIPVVVTTYGYITLYNNSNGYVFSPLLRLIEPLPFVYHVSLMIIIIGMVVGMIGSTSAVRRYLKV